MLYKLLDVVTETTDGSPFSIASANGSTIGLCQVQYTGSITGNVQIQGRLDSSLEWVDLLDEEITGDDAQAVALFPEMRAVLADGSGTGTVSVYLFAER